MPQTKTLRHREVRQPVQGHRAGKCTARIQTPQSRVSQCERPSRTFHLLIAGRGRRPSGVTRTRSSRGARKGQGTCESERREPIPEGPKPPHSRLAGSSTFRLRLLVFAPPPTRLLVQPTPHSGGDTPPPIRGEEAGSPRMFAAARPRGSIWLAGPETALQGHRSVL